MSEPFTLARLLTEAAAASADHAETHRTIKLSIQGLNKIIINELNPLNAQIGNLQHRLSILEKTVHRPKKQP